MGLHLDKLIGQDYTVTDFRGDNHNMFMPYGFVVFSNTFLKPYHYLYGATEIVVLKNEITQIRPVVYEKNMLKTAVAVATLIPGFILGVLWRLLDFLPKDYRDAHKVVEQFYQRKIELPQPPSGMALQQYRVEMTPLIDNVTARIRLPRPEENNWNWDAPIIVDHRNEPTPDPVPRMNVIMNSQDNENRPYEALIWKDRRFICDFTRILENASRYSEVYFRQLSQECNGNPHAMADRMFTQQQNSTDFSRGIFYLPTLYHQARAEREPAQMTLREEEVRTPTELKPPAPSESTDHYYFDPRTPHYYWRELYNRFCDQLDQYKLRPALRVSGQTGRQMSDWATKEVKSPTKWI